MVINQPLDALGLGFSPHLPMFERTTQLCFKYVQQIKKKRKQIQKFKTSAGVFL